MRSECARNALGPAHDLAPAQTSSPPPVGTSGSKSSAAPVSLEVGEEIVSRVAVGRHTEKGSALSTAAKVIDTGAGARICRSEYHCSVRVRVGRRAIDISNPDKVLFPRAGFTKSDVVEYYRRVAPTMLPYVRGRPVTLHRYPDGIDVTGFYQKEAADYFPSWVRTQRVAKEGGSLSMVIVNDAATLVYLAGQAMITPHVWLSRVDRRKRPDRMIIDLDPPNGEFAAVRQAAVRVRARLEELGLVSFVMTTGSSGLHVVVPLKRTASFETVRRFARQVADELSEEHAAVLTTEQRKAKRRARVYLDTLRNAYGQTAVAPYALRARPGGPVATPLDWDELDQRDMSSTRYTLRTVLERLDAIGDPWKGMGRRARSIGGAQRKLGDR